MGQVGRRPAGDQVAVHHDRAVLPQHARVDQVVFDRADAGAAAALHDPRRDRHPPGVADEGDRLARVVDLPGDLEHPGRAAQDVRRVAARNDQGVEVRRLDLVHRGVGRDRIAAFSLVALLAQAGDDAGGALLLQADLGVPELEVFVERGGEDEDVFSGKHSGQGSGIRIQGTAGSKHTVSQALVPAGDQRSILP